MCDNKTRVHFNNRKHNKKKNLLQAGLSMCEIIHVTFATKFTANNSSERKTTSIKSSIIPQFTLHSPVASPFPIPSSSSSIHIPANVLNANCRENCGECKFLSIWILIYYDDLCVAGSHLHSNVWGIEEGGRVYARYHLKMLNLYTITNVRGKNAREMLLNEEQIS